MALVSLLFKQRVRIGVDASAELLPFGAVELDASIEERHAAANAITQFPVESGVDIADHVRRQPDRVTIRGIVSDQPLFPGFSGRSLDAYRAFRVMLEQAQTVAVVTTLRTYENMVVETMDVPRNARLGNAVEITIELRELLTAQVATAADTTDFGAQSATAA